MKFCKQKQKIDFMQKFIHSDTKKYYQVSNFK